MEQEQPKGGWTMHSLLSDWWNNIEFVQGLVYSLLVAGTVSLFVAVWGVKYVKKLWAYVKTLEDQAMSDPLTGLGNRRALDIWIQDAIDDAERYGHDFSVIAIDLDKLKRVNDNQGHDAGDRLLVMVAGAIIGRVRTTDKVVRTGGDEFVIILTNTSLTRAEVVAESIRANIQHLSREGLQISASIGIANYEKNCKGKDSCNILQYADKACYLAKRADDESQGGNRVKVYYGPGRERS